MDLDLAQTPCLHASWEEEKVVAVTQQLHPLDKPLNGYTTLPVGASSSVSVARLSCKSVYRILDRKNRLIGNERILDVSSDYLE